MFQLWQHGTPPSFLLNLQANTPEDSELAALYAYLDEGGDPADLGPAEQLFAALRGVPRLQQKLKARRACQPVRLTHEGGVFAAL